jgi:chromosome segregation ATPase
MNTDEQSLTEISNDSRKNFNNYLKQLKQILQLQQLKKQDELLSKILQQNFKLRHQLKQLEQDNENKLQKINVIYCEYQENNNQLILLLQQLQQQPQLQQNQDLLMQIQTQLHQELQEYLGTITNVQVNFILQLHPELTNIEKKIYSSMYEQIITSKAKISELTNTKMELFDILTKKNVDIDNLKEENNKLKIQLEQIQNEMEIINYNYNGLKMKHDELTMKHDGLQQEITEMKNNKAFDRFVIAIQDLNREESLEKKVSSRTQKILQELREDRIDDCHYINDNDSKQKKDDKRNILYDEIKNMPKSLRDMFDNLYPNVLNDIDKYIINQKSTPSPSFVAKTKRWFYC